MERNRAELERRLELAVEELLNAHHAFKQVRDLFEPPH